MSNDLISRKELLKQFIVSSSGHRTPEYDCDNFPITISVKDVKDIIRKAPKAFDKEKVKEELHDAADISVEDGLWHVELQEALEIVEKGGMK